MFQELPYRSARLAWWLTGWLRGTASPDDVLDHTLGDDVAHDVAGWPDAEGTTSLILALPRLRALGADSAGLALPEPGQSVGLGGPGEFNASATAVGEAIVLGASGFGLVPHHVGHGVVWQLHPARRRQLVDLGEADRALRLSLTSTASALADLDVARWRPEVADELMNLRHQPQYAAPASTPPQAVALAGRAVQALGIVDLALDDDGGAVSAAEATLRRDALTPLGSAARVALVAACSPEVWPPSARPTGRRYAQP